MFGRFATAHKAIRYCCKLVWEVFSNSPYRPVRACIKGVPAHKAVWYLYKLARETFANNPYGLPAWCYFLTASAMIACLCCSFILGALEGYECQSWVPLVKGTIGALPFLWLIQFGLHPP
jgi:hypothetical protein